MRVVSHDPTCRATIELSTALGRCTAVELQWEFLRLAQKYADETGLERVRRRRRWAATCSPAGSWSLAALERDPAALDGQLDWVTKSRCSTRTRPRRAGLGRPQARRCSTCSTTTYARSGPSTSGWCGRARSSAWSTRPTCAPRSIDPPATTRAYFRGTCLARWPEAVVAANWDSLILDIGGDPLKRIPMMEPLRGTKAHVEPLFASVDTPGQLVERLAL